MYVHASLLTLFLAHRRCLTSHIVQVNLIYLSTLCSRIALIPPLISSTPYLGQDDHTIPFLTFGKIFDLPLLREEIRHPVFDWKDLKRGKYDEAWGGESQGLEGVDLEETLGCWSTSRVYKGDLELLLGLGESFWAIPKSDHESDAFVLGISDAFHTLIPQSFLLSVDQVQHAGTHLQVSPPSSIHTIVQPPSATHLNPNQIHSSHRTNISGVSTIYTV